MPIAKEATTDPALEAQVFWYKYRKEIAILLGLAVLGIVGVAGYRLYRDRREGCAAHLRDDHDAISRQLRSHGSEPVAANVFENGETGNTAGCCASENGRFGDRYGSTNHENNASRATCAEWCAISGSETIARAE